jgi:hypothetical protein
MASGTRRPSTNWFFAECLVDDEETGAPSRQWATIDDLKGQGTASDAALTLSVAYI